MEPSVYIVRCAPHPQGATRPSSARDAHLAYLRSHADTLRFAGPALAEDGTKAGSWAIVEGTRADAERFIEHEPFHLAGSFGEVTIQRFRPQVGSRQVDLVPVAGTALFFCRWDAADGDSVPWDGTDRHFKVLEHGPLTDDAGEHTIGHLLLLEVRSASGAYRERLDLLTSDPAAMTADRWRFGNALGGGGGPSGPDGRDGPG